jgi:cytochrome b6-f complex iron-sulfur subunit
MPNPSRRDFMKLATTGLLSAAGLIGLGGLMRFLAYDSEPAAKTVIDLGDVSDFPAGAHKIFPEIPAILYSTATGLKALSLVCTHLGCTVEQFETGFRCPCHGSRYDGQGQVKQGPARLPLRALRLETTPEGHLLLHTD